MSVLAWLVVGALLSPGVPVVAPGENGRDTEPAWSPDGNQIAFTSSRTGRPALFVMSATGDAESLLPGTGDADLHPDFGPAPARHTAR